MRQNNQLFFPEGETVDKLLSIFNIQSQEQLPPEKVINILSLLNLLNITSTSSQASPLQNNQEINTLLNNLKSQNNNQLQELMTSLNGSNNSSALNNLFSSNNNPNNNQQNNSLDPTLVLKLMNLINQFKSSAPKKEKSEENTESNEPVKSEPNDSNSEE